MSWRVAASLLQLRDQINTAWPNRNKAADGTIGDAAHSARASDHNPNDAGVVCAMDITHDPENGVDIDKLSDALAESRDDRIAYLIANALIWSSTGPNAGRWVPYYGPNPHRHHLHVSVKASRCDVKKPWAIGNAAEDDMDQETPITQANDVVIGAAKGGSITRPFRWWLSAAYSHIIGLETPVKKLGEAVAAQTTLLNEIKTLLTAHVATPRTVAPDVDINALADRILERLGDSNAADIARRIGNG